MTPLYKWAHGGVPATTGFVTTALLNDGSAADTSTYQSASYSNGQGITVLVDFSVPVTVLKIRATHRISSGGGPIVTHYSSDATNWTSFVAASSPGSSFTTTTLDATSTSGAITARYWRYYFQNEAPTTGTQDVSDIRFYDASDVILGPTTIRYAAGTGDAPASVTTNTTLVDDYSIGDTGTYVEETQNTGSPATITVMYDLGTSAPVTKYSFTYFSFGTGTHHLERSNDGSTWTDVVASATSASGGTYSNSSVSFNARYLRLSLSAAAVSTDGGVTYSTSHAQVSDFRIYDGSYRYSVNYLTPTIRRRSSFATF